MQSKKIAPHKMNTIKRNQATELFEYYRVTIAVEKNCPKVCRVGIIVVQRSVATDHQQRILNELKSRPAAYFVLDVP